jgi:NADH-quinone oxidoreductase subunit B
VGLARANSLWPLPLQLLVAELNLWQQWLRITICTIWFRTCKFSPRQADMLMVMGTISKKMAPILRQVYEQMSEPRWVIAVGACASSGGILIRIRFYKELIK